jgi:UMF1 family MFS transporter
MLDKNDGLNELTQDQRRVIRGWCMYDWANSGFATSAVVAILPVYFVFLFKDAFGEEANFFGLTLTGSSMWSLGVVISTAFVAVTSPILGVIADRVPIKKTFLWLYTIVGSVFTVLSFFSAYTGAAWAWIFGTFVIANIGFAGGLVFYNSFLPHLVPKHLLDNVSSRGYAYGYIGGGLLLAVHLVIIVLVGDSVYSDLVTRLALASVGLWWFGWALWTFRTVPEPVIANPVTGLNVVRAVSLALSQLNQTIKEIRRFKIVAIYLAAFLLFNDGVQTVLTIAGAFAADTLGVSLTFNMVTILIIQLIAAPGAMYFSRLAKKIRAKRALVISLLGWCVVVMFGIGVAPFAPDNHDDFDYQIEYKSTYSIYTLVNTPALSDSPRDIEWLELQSYHARQGQLTQTEVVDFASVVASYPPSRFTLSVIGGNLDGLQSIGPVHPSNLTQGPMDFWPRILRENLWGPLGITVNYQWLLLGIFVGVVMGGSQALARSIFAYITPESRSGEFFGFFGFISRASAVFGPIIYVLFTSVYDTRTAIFAILSIILVGTVLLRWVDVEKGRKIAIDEDALHKEMNP